MGKRLTDWFFNTGPLRVGIAVWVVLIMTFVIIHYVLFPGKLDAATLAVPLAIIGLFVHVLPKILSNRQPKQRKDG